MRVKDLVKKVAAVVIGQLGVPYQAVDLPDADGFQGEAAVIAAILRLKVNGIALYFPAD